MTQNISQLQKQIIIPLPQNKNIFNYWSSSDMAWEVRRCYISLSFCNRQYGKNLSGARVTICPFSFS